MSKDNSSTVQPMLYALKIHVSISSYIVEMLVKVSLICLSIYILLQRDAEGISNKNQ